MTNDIGSGRWALILGASSGFGEACARALAAAGYDIFGVHLDRRAGLEHVEEIKASLEALGRRAIYFNMNAAHPGKMERALDEMEKALGEGETIGVLMHSLAFGTLRPYVGAKGVTGPQMDMTLRVMAHSLVDWTRAVLDRELMGANGRIFAMTSSGSNRIIPHYGPVSAAKAALESHCRQLSYELAPLGITVNALRGGVTDTPALRKIPGSEALIEGAVRRNPSGRLTTPEDVANAVVALCSPLTSWVAGRGPSRGDHGVAARGPRRFVGLGVRDRHRPGHRFSISKSSKIRGPSSSSHAPSTTEEGARPPRRRGVAISRPSDRRSGEGLRARGQSPAAFELRSIPPGNRCASGP